MADSDRYNRVAIALHWSMAILLIGLIALGYYMVDVPKNTPERAYFFNLHKSLGLLALLLVVARIAWRAMHKEPAPLASMPAWQIKASIWTHRLLYLLMFLQPVTGYLSSSFNKYGVKFFGLKLPNWGWDDKGLRELFGETHEIMVIAFIAVIALHILAALKHRIIDKDQVLQRMMP